MAISVDTTAMRKQEKPLSCNWSKILVAALLASGMLLMILSLTVLNQQHDDGSNKEATAAGTSSSNSSVPNIEQSNSSAGTSSLASTTRQSNQSVTAIDNDRVDNAAFAENLTSYNSTTEFRQDDLNGTTTNDAAVDSSKTAANTTTRTVTPSVNNPKTTWPDLVGTTAEAAAAVIRNDNPNILDITVIAHDAFVTQEYVPTRVRLFVYINNNTIAVAPMVG